MILQEKLSSYKVILGSGSPRRKKLLQEMGLIFTTMVIEGDESYPPELKYQEIPVYISKKKAGLYRTSLQDDHSVLITADTIVWLEGKVMPKPQNYSEAYNILSDLSGKTHEVITGVTISSQKHMHSFSAVSRVTFKTLRKEEIDFYLTHFKPYDKAGSYGIQEWIGYTGIIGIEGSYFNVVGLPTCRLYQELENFLMITENQKDQNQEDTLNCR